jgi:hypothetical protein
MGEAADRKVSEIESTRRRIEDDLNELENRLPAPLRSARALGGAVVGSSAVAAVSGWFLKRRQARRRKEDRATEVVIRVVRDDGSPATADPADHERS